MYVIRTALTKILEANGENGSYTIILTLKVHCCPCNLGQESPVVEETMAIIHCAVAESLRESFFCVSERTGNNMIITIKPGFCLP